MAFLHVLKGTNQGQKIVLEGGCNFVMGRNADSHVVINDPAVGRIHASIVIVSGKYYLEDGDGIRKSRNGTYLNNRLLEKERLLLKNNDRIKICDFLCTFMDEEERKPLPAHFRHAEEEEVEVETSSTVEATLSHSSQQVLETQPGEIVKFFLEITSNLGQTFDLDALLAKIVERLFVLFKQADRGFIIMKDEATEKLIPKVIQTRRPHDESTARFSRTIVNRCIQTCQAFLSEDATTDKKLDPSASIADCRIRSVMCAPLTAQDNTKAFGVIQLDSQDRSKRFTADDLKLLVAVASVAAIALENARLHEVLLTRDRMRRDMELARSVQLSFLPHKLPEVPGYHFFAHYESALEVGGDYYDFIPLPNRGLALMIGDVAGKGAAAALLMAKISSDARFCMLTEPTPEKAIVNLNALLHLAGLSDRFVTLAAGLLDPSNHRATFVNAGHLSPMIYKKESNHFEDVVSRDLTGFPLGVVEGFPYESAQVTLAPGDCVLIFTDGVTEAKDKAGRDLGVDRLLPALKEGPLFTPQALGERALKAVKQHSLGCPQHDDITVVCFGRT